MESTSGGNLVVGILTIHLHLPGCASLKEKRGRLKPLLNGLHKKFNVSVAEMDRQDMWQEAVIACALVNSDAKQVQRSLQTVVRWVEGNWTDGDVIDERIELV
jgi:uncharacterized protein YlxP (DUF503 family)